MVSNDFYNTAAAEGEGVIDYPGLPDTNTQSVGKVSTGRHKNTWQDCAQSFLISGKSGSYLGTRPVRQGQT